MITFLNVFENFPSCLSFLKIFFFNTFYICDSEFKMLQTSRSVRVLRMAQVIAMLKVLSSEIRFLKIYTD